MEMLKQTIRRCRAELLFSMAVAVFVTIQGGSAQAQTAESSATTSSINQTHSALGPSSSGTQITALSLQEAIQLSIANNLNTRLAGERRNEALGAKIQALAALLPNVSASASQASNTVNLAAQGLTPKIFPIPATLIGPFNSFYTRFSLRAVVLNPQLHPRLSIGAGRRATRRSAREAGARAGRVIGVAGLSECSAFTERRRNGAGKPQFGEKLADVGEQSEERGR